MNRYQTFALAHHCRFAFECAHPQFRYALFGNRISIVLTVNSGYELLEANFGGPVWHASAALVNPFKHGVKETLRSKALGALEGVGEKRQQWEEWTTRAYHIRRRLTAEEHVSVGDVVDLRRTEEGWERFRALQEQLAPSVARFAVQEIQGQ